KNIEVSSITLNESSKTLYVGDSFSLQASIYPDNASDKSVTWSSDNGAVATVQDGLVNAVSSGNAIITARAGTRLARCRITVNKKINEYTMGETWEVADQWRFTINSVTTHYKCNNYSDKTGEQVILINYSYYNTGYEGSTQDLFFYGMENVYDENGTAASRYPCTHTKYPDVCVIGTNCTASCSYILPHASTNIKVYIEHWTSNGLGKEKAIYNLKIPEPFPSETPAPDTPTPTPPAVIPDYQKNAERLKSYIIDNGLTDSDGYKYVETTMIHTDDAPQGKIIYIPENNVFIIQCELSKNNLTSTSLIYYSIPETKVIDVKHICKHAITSDYDYDFSYTAQATMDINTYTPNTNLKFSAISGESRFVNQTLCNESAHINLIMTDAFLQKELSDMALSLAALGFSAFYYE
ncbi:MAG: Ig-like domain-containing protein, partial [Lachnospiraceae bacterium]|nr:Ig-like domain-containing protein [Lachnospiraceae bacterium]